MGYVGTGQTGHTYIGSGIGASGTFKQMGTNSNLTAHGVVVAEGNSPFVAVGPTATTGAVLQNNAGADPSYSTASYPSTTAAGSILYSPSANVVDDLATTASATLVSNSSAVPVWTSAMTNGQVVIGSTGGTPTAATLTAGSGIAITNAAGSITIASQSAPIVGATNLGIAYSGGTFTVQGADGTALSASNPAYVTLQSKATPGRLVTIPVTANQTFTDGSGGGIDNWRGGLLTGISWSEDIPFFLYAVSNDSQDSIAFMISRYPGLPLSPVSSKISKAGSIVNVFQNDFFSLANITVTSYDENPCLCVGAFRMQFAGATDSFTVQTLSNKDGIGRFLDDVTFTYPLGVNGAATGKVFRDNGGTAPGFASYVNSYHVQQDGMCDFYLVTGQCNAAGVGAVNLQPTVPYNIYNTAIAVAEWADSGVSNYPIVCTAVTGDTYLNQVVIQPGGLLSNAAIAPTDNIYVTIRFKMYAA